MGEGLALWDSAQPDPPFHLSILISFHLALPVSNHTSFLAGP